MSKHITDEAVEAAVKAWDHHWGDRYGDEALEEMGEEVRVALEAAAPFIKAQALEEAAELVTSPRAKTTDADRAWAEKVRNWLSKRAETYRTAK